MSEQPHTLFVSHASNDRVGDKKQRLVKWVEVLEGEIKVKTGHPNPDRIVFLDAKSIQLAEFWQTALKTALGSAEMLLCCVSPYFLQSEWCGKEVTCFLERCSQHAGAGSGFVFLLLWESHPNHPLPAALSEFQFKHDDLPKKYLEIGLRQLLALGTTSERAKVLKVFSDRIRDAFHLPLVQKIPQAAIPDFQSIKSAFAVTGVRLFVFCDQSNGLDWRPGTQAQPIRRILSQIRSIAGASELQNLGSAIQPANDLVLVLTTAASTEPSSELTKIAESCSGNLAILRIREGMEGSSISNLKWVADGNPELKKAEAQQRIQLSLLNDLESAIDLLVAKVETDLRLRQTPVKQAVDARLESAADSTNTPFRSIPILSGKDNV